ncbi:hypothetical protein ACLBR5_03190 [Escherichia coli]
MAQNKMSRKSLKKVAKEKYGLDVELVGFSCYKRCDDPDRAMSSA